MANLVETSTWESGIYQWEETDPLEGGAAGIDNVPTGQLANRTTKIKDECEKHGIYIAGTYQYAGQNIILTDVFEGTVADRDIVYWNSVSEQYEKALADGSASDYAVGVADVTNDRIICSGLYEVAVSGATQNDILYLSHVNAAEITTTVSTVAIGKYLFDDIILISIIPATVYIANDITEDTNNNTGSVTVTSSNTTLIDVDLGTVTLGDFFMATGQVTLTKGATAGNFRTEIIQGSGTATIKTSNNSGSIVHDSYIEASAAGISKQLSTIFHVDQAGTLVLRLRAVSAGSDSTVSAGNGRLGVSWLKKQ